MASFYPIIDLEMCKIPKGIVRSCHVRTEIIQIGAVLLDEQFEIKDKFATYVKPQYGWIDPKIEKLTGINYDQVKNAPFIKVAVSMFLDWLPDEDGIMVSWSTTDKNQLERELEAKGIEFDRMAQLYESWFDCQEMFVGKVEAGRLYTLKEALIAADILSEGREHDGLADAWNTALLFAKMQDEHFKFNPYYEVASKEKSETLSVSLGELFKDLRLPKGEVYD